MILMTSIWSFLTFDYIWILTQGGPAGASEVLATLVVKNAFLKLEAGYASAIGLTMSIFVGIVIGIFIVLRQAGVGDLSIAASPTAPGAAAAAEARRELACSNHIVLILLVDLRARAAGHPRLQLAQVAAEIGQQPARLAARRSSGELRRTPGMSATSPRRMRNSGILVALTVAGVLILGGMAAYSLAKLDLPGSGRGDALPAGRLSLPLQLFLVPLFFLWQRLGLINSLPGLAIIYIAINAPLAIFLLRSYMVQLPTRLRGCRPGRRRQRVADLHQHRRAALLARLSHRRAGGGAVGLERIPARDRLPDRAGTLHRRHQLLQLHLPSSAATGG